MSATKKTARPAVKKAPAKPGTAPRSARKSTGVKRHYERETFRISAGPGGRLANASFDRCTFVNPWLYTKADVFVDAERLEFEKCIVRTRGLSKIVARDVRIIESKKSPLIRISNSMFDRVTFEGDFNRMFFSWIHAHLTPQEIDQTERFYASVPFAIDVRNARFRELTIRGIPGHLVLRDPATSILVRRDVLATRSDWRDDERFGIWPDEFDLFLSNAPRYESAAFVAGVLSDDLEETLARFETLRREGLAT